MSLYLALQLIGDTLTKYVYKRVITISYIHLDIELKYTNYKIYIKILSNLSLNISETGYLKEKSVK